MSIEKSIKQSHFENPHHKMLVNIMYTGNWIDNIARDLLGKYDLTHPQFNILRILAGAAPKPMAAGAIKAVMVFRNSDITRMIDRMVKKNLVTREACPENKRKMDISISEAGKALLSEVNPALKLAMKDFFADKVSAEEAETLSRLLDKIRS